MKFLILLFCCVGLNLHAQQKFYFVAFKDKPNYKQQLAKPLTYLSKKAVDRRLKYRVALNANDIPPDSAYAAKIERYPLLLFGKSRWLNGVVVLSGLKNLADTLKRLNFVDKVTYLGPQTTFMEDDALGSALNEQISILEQTFEPKSLLIDTAYLGKSFKQINQINAQQLLLDHKNGQGVLIAIIDAGFKHADQLPAFKKMFDDGRLLATYDFVQLEEEVFDDDEHGLGVFSCLAANQPGLIMGTAPMASYLLLRSEDVSAEYLTEEYLWTLAAEYADSAGADIINSSLGYTQHDDLKMGHTYKELDGKSTIVTQAAEIADSKGILVFVSAGNEGNVNWKKLSAPGDAPHAVTVGAVDATGTITAFSSMGPTADRRMKPDLVALGKSTAVISSSGTVYYGNGTSYACPILAGASAILMEVAPFKTPAQIKEALMISGSNYFNPDKFIGSGLPDIELAAKILTVNADSLLDARVLEDLNLWLLINLKQDQKIVVSLVDASNTEVLKNNITLKKGANRIILKGYLKIQAGTYRLRVQFNNRIKERKITKP
ncbi:MAG: S8 family serine peptidase [Bacteroidia bacterium]|nr:S8 family serine peptidase [Bacteroidia bacterium]